MSELKWSEIEINGQTVKKARLDFGPLRESGGRVFGSFGAVDCELELAPDAHARLVDAIRLSEECAERRRRAEHRRRRMARRVARARRATL